MALSKTLSENLKSPIGNSLLVFLEDRDNTLKMKDIYGNVENFSSYFNPSSLYNGAFSDSTTQTTLGNEIKAMKFGNTDISNGVSVQNNTQLKVNNSGVYNIQFSAQIVKTSGGTNETIYIWFRKNGVNVPNSNTALSLANNSQFLVASWNFMSQMNANDFLEIMWYTTDNHIQLQYQGGTANYPAIPSVIATMNNV